MTSCSGPKLAEKGFQVASASDNRETEQADGINKDSLKFEIRPGNILLTGVPHIRLAPLYKVNFKKDHKSSFIGSNTFHTIYEETESTNGNNWHMHIVPGFEAVYGYNMVNVSHYNISENKQKTFFEKPVLIKTLYYPSFTKDTLQYQAVNRDYVIVSVYTDDTNKDGFINLKDLRRMYLFSINGEKQKALIPENYSVFKSEYDSANDFMYVSAQADLNDNGRRDEAEPVHIFWIDLKNPTRTGRLY